MYQTWDSVCIPSCVPSLTGEWYQLWEHEQRWCCENTAGSCPPAWVCLPSCHFLPPPLPSLTTVTCYIVLLISNTWLSSFIQFPVLHNSMYTRTGICKVYKCLINITHCTAPGYIIWGVLHTAHCIWVCMKIWCFRGEASPLNASCAWDAVSISQFTPV